MYYSFLSEFLEWGMTIYLDYLHVDYFLNHCCYYHNVSGSGLHQVHDNPGKIYNLERKPSFNLLEKIVHVPRIIYMHLALI